MKKMWVLVGIISVILVGCNNEDEMVGEAHVSGEITDKRANSIFVEENDTEVVWVHVPDGENANDYEVGQHVQVWTDGVLMESDPPQMNALHIEVVQDEVTNEEQTLKVQKLIGDENKYEDLTRIVDQQQVQQASEIVEQVNWEKSKVQMENPPEYRFSFPNSEEKSIEYQVWITPNNIQLELTYADGHYTKLSKEQSAILFEILNGEKLPN